MNYISLLESPIGKWMSLDYLLGHAFCNCGYFFYAKYMKREKLLFYFLFVFVGMVFGGCEKEKVVKYQTGVHKVVVKQSGDTSDFDLRLTIGAAGPSGLAKLYNDKGTYVGDSYSLTLENSILSCQTSLDAFYITCTGSVTSSRKVGKRLKVTVIVYVNDQEVNRLDKEYITKANMLVENFTVSSRISPTSYDEF